MQLGASLLCLLSSGTNVVVSMWTPTCEDAPTSISAVTKSREVKVVLQFAGGVELPGAQCPTIVIRRNTILSINHEEIKTYSNMFSLLP